MKERKIERKIESKKGRTRMKKTEGIDLEFKKINRKTGKLPDSINKEICAFANTEGGELFIGVSDDGCIVGVDDVDDVMTRVSNTIRDNVMPDVIPFIQIRNEEKEGKSIVKIEVSVGTERPYYLKSKGLTPSGVYVRRGSASVPVNEAGIRNMIMESSGVSFEENRSLNQDLTFETLKQEMEIRALDFGQSQMKTLKLIGTDGLYTNLALLLSDQCPYTIKAAIFQGTDNAVFRERQEFAGSLLKQLNEAYKFLNFYNKTKATFSGVMRTDTRDYPEDALREALLNSIIHRDYLFSGSNIINMFDDHIEINSLGGLFSGLSMDAIMLGVSQSRNPNLATVFYRLKLVESYGTGIRKIKQLYSSNVNKPEFKTAEGAFSVILPNINENINENNNNVIQDENNDEKEKVITFVKDNGSITRQQTEKITGYKSTKAYKLLRDLMEEGKLKQKKEGKLTQYY